MKCSIDFYQSDHFGINLNTKSKQLRPSCVKHEIKNCFTFHTSRRKSIAVKEEFYLLARYILNRRKSNLCAFFGSSFFHDCSNHKYACHHLFEKA